MNNKENLNAYDDALYRRINNASNIYLAYLRIKNDFSNSELKLTQEYQYFENHIEKEINKIEKTIKDIAEGNDYHPEKFHFLVKIKDTGKKKSEEENNDKEGNGPSYRPLVKFPLDILVLMQAVFNIVIDELKNYLPKENYGVQLNDSHSQYLYKNWTHQYKKFVKKQSKYLDSESVYQYCFEYDIKQFYPSIPQEKLIKKLKDDLCLKDKSQTYKLIKWCVEYYKIDNISDETKDIYKYYLEQINKKDERNEKDKSIDLGLPQGPLFSSFLASYYTNDMYKKIKEQISNEYGMDCEYFTYVDDGRIYFRENIDEADIKNMINTYFEEISNDNKKIKVNEDKTCMLSLDKNSITAKLHLLTCEASIMNNALDPNFQLNDDIIHTYKEKNEDIENKIRKMEKNLSLDYNKIKKELSTFTKRTATSFSKLAVNGEEFYKTVEKIFDKEFKFCEVNDFNFNYVLKNLAESVNDKNKAIFLSEHVVGYLEKVKKDYKINKELMYYYYLIAIRNLLLIDPNYLSVEEVYQIFNLDIDLKKTDLFYSFAFYSDNLLRMDELIGNVDEIKEKDVYIIKATSHYLQHPIQITFDYLEKTIEQLPSLSKNMPIKPIYIYDKNFCMYEVYINNKKNQVLEMDGIKHLDILNMDYKASIKILKIALNTWKSLYEKNGYIDASYLIYDYYFYSINDTDNKYFKEKLYILNVSHTYFNQYDSARMNNDYRKLFTNFFMKYFGLETFSSISSKNNILKFWQYRIISYLKNTKFNLSDFLEILNDCLEKEEYQQHDVDINFEKVREILDNNLESNMEKDVILQLHYYVTCLWKNGAKDLPFYTLHNQEHSIELIYNYQRLKSIMFGKLRLEAGEVFILFCACYLHDIGLLLELSEKEMYSFDDERVTEFYTDIKNLFINDQSKKRQYYLSKAYEVHNKTEQFFENGVRGRHPHKSQRLINNISILPLTDLERVIIGKVSKNHGENNDKVYGTVDTVYYKGLGEARLYPRKIDIRIISIWLRLLDLTDIAKNRVSQDVFDRYYGRMGIVSRFHWIKHLCTDEIIFKNSYDRTSDGLVGKLTIIFSVKMNYIPAQEKMKIKKSNCYKFKASENNVFEFEEKKCEDCNLRCAFLNENYYFIQEIESLNKYMIFNELHTHFKFQYQAEDDSEKNDFKVTHNDNQSKKASQCIKEYLNEMYQ